ncbi:ABC transporter ATP-binding protein [Mesorhizobium sp. M7A.F.Ca.US.006.01.1.1]|uniref:ABC transporter ATP-binding protein n=1 Tax=Mesorhizobium sp. M7A.F.Ca.US.006.01.1.1 TaxID=2496707 RepID=UPI000FCB018A|nr:ABC transporter ATP-binding protein [Mesorhizobium sp. M7A.F.Ca.US.006.01.1.1]RUZ77970.1 ABC transporter ATP-binding protein [Mesorhizobium sp. M7A.F.Ca.US.006.01.1.1]
MSDVGYALQVRGLSKRFGDFLAVKNVSLDIRAAGIHGIIGPNGAGKTTVFNILTKFLAPTTGTIWFHGQDITRLTPVEIARRGIVRSFQISAVFPNLTVLQNLEVALQRQAGLASQFWRSRKILAQLNDRAFDLLRSVGLGEFWNVKAKSLPYGRKRTLEIATTLALEPKLLLLDEPMAGMGHEDIASVSSLIRSLADRYAIIMIEHNLSVVSDICDRISVLSRGEVIAEGPYSEVSRNSAVRDAYIGGADG